MHAQVPSPSEPVKRHSHDSSIDDDVLWIGVRQGNQLSFSLLYKRYVQRLFNYGMHACGERELVKDCLQELFARLWDKRETLGAAGSVNYYLFRSFRRLLLLKLVARKKYATPFSKNQANLFEFIPSSEEEIIHGETTQLQKERLTQAIQTLARRQREAVFLKFYNELSYHEVAAIMELKVESVYNLISRAIDILRQRLKEVVFLVLLLPF